MLVDFFGNTSTKPIQLDRGLLEGAIAQNLNGITADQLVSMMYSKIAAIIRAIYKTAAPPRRGRPSGNRNSIPVYGGGQ